METAYTPAYVPVYAELAQTPAEESPYISRPADRADQRDHIDERGREKPVSFKEILAGLLRKGETDRGGEAYGESTLDETTSFAAEAPLEAEALPAAAVLAGIPAAGIPAAVPVEALSGEKRAAAAGRNQGLISGKTESAGGPEKAVMTVKSGKSGTIDEELSALEFSEEDKNILLSVELLLNRSAEPVPIDDATGEAALAGEIRLEAEGLERADIAALFAGQGEDAETPPAGAFTEAAEPAESPKARRFAGNEGVPGGGLDEAGKLAALAPAAVQPEQAVLRKNSTEKEGRGRLDEVRGRDRRRDRLSFAVRDLRNGGEGLKTESAPLKASAETRVQGESAARELTLELHLPDQSRNAPSAETAGETKAAQVFEDILARELHQNVNNDIVRHASMVLRDEGRGTIRLALKPETLGNVKIRLEMAENKITGHIVVESEEAMRAFEREIHSLEQAFKESGFQSANLEMSLAADGGQADQSGQEPGANPFLPGAAFRYEAPERAEMPLSDIFDVYQRRLTSVNVLA
ncbi:MAG: flagellar hook-length control protein FliK [Treponema sp.]|nr:flagellar hook-length control protein FliK [Treponema sp.]